jgi:hypothetical protein
MTRKNTGYLQHSSNIILEFIKLTVIIFNKNFAVKGKI